MATPSNSLPTNFVGGLPTKPSFQGFTFQNQTRNIITAQELLSESLGLPKPARGSGISEEAFIQQLADAVDYWMQHRMEQLMSLCYTLDVSEAAVAEAFHPSAPEAANIGLARLLYQRQCRRLETKERYKSQPLDDEDAW